jgi:hypothetical protein
MYKTIRSLCLKYSKQQNINLTAYKTIILQYLEYLKSRQSRNRGLLCPPHMLKRQASGRIQNVTPQIHTEVWSSSRDSGCIPGEWSFQCP